MRAEVMLFLLFLLILRILMWSVPHAIDGHNDLTGIKHHAFRGKSLLLKGQYAYALAEYHAAIIREPSNYMLVFERAITHMALGKMKYAVKDFTRVLELKPEFVGAFLQRATVYMKIGEYDEATEDLEKVLQFEPQNSIAQKLASRIQPAKKLWQQAQEFIDKGEPANAIPALTELLELSPWCLAIRTVRANAYVALNETNVAISDFRSVYKMSQNVEGHLKVALQLYKDGHYKMAVAEMRNCLKLHPEHHECLPLYKKLRIIEKELGTASAAHKAHQYGICIDAANKLFRQEPLEPMIVVKAKSLLCQCYYNDKQIIIALHMCNEALEIKADDARSLCVRGAIFLDIYLYDEAGADFAASLKLEPALGCAITGTQISQDITNQYTQKDYYKILDVPRDADNADILKAYRKAVKIWHPDNHEGTLKGIAEKKFLDIYASKLMLTNPRKRQEFDAELEKSG